MFVIAPASGELDVGSSELQAVKGYLTVLEAKLLQPLSQTFCLFPIDDANCGYLDRLIFGASTA